MAIAGLCDTVKWLEAERGFESIVTSPAYTYTLRLLGPEPALDDISPIKHIDKVTVPILIMHGRDDSVVPMTQSTDMFNALKNAGKTCEYYEVEHAEHGATTEASRLEILGHTLTFIEKYNPPYLPGDAVPARDALQCCQNKDTDGSLRRCLIFNFLKPYQITWLVTSATMALLTQIILPPPRSI